MLDQMPVIAANTMHGGRNIHSVAYLSGEVRPEGLARISQR